MNEVLCSINQLKNQMTLNKYGINKQRGLDPARDFASLLGAIRPRNLALGQELPRPAKHRRDGCTSGNVSWWVFLWPLIGRDLASAPLP
jgi:hypothetical protein